MKRLLLLAALCCIAAVPAGAEPPAGDDPWLSRLVGHWVLEGRIAGKDTTHDVDAEWVLNHLYVRLHEVSREGVSVRCDTFDGSYDHVRTVE